MKILTINNQEQWDGWLKNNSQHNSFTQSWAWGDILFSEGKNVERLAVVENDKILAQAQVVFSKIIFGWQYAFCPQGPVISYQFAENGSQATARSSQVYQCILDYLKNKNCIFFRVEPDLQTENWELRTKKTIDINPPATLILDLAKSEDRLLVSMHQKARYNIRLAEKKNLQIKDEKNLAVFWSLMTKTGSRDKFGLHHKEHYEKVLASPMIFQLTAYEKDKPVACAVFSCFGDMFTYLYGASDHDYRQLMAPYLLQWEGIKKGKKLGCRWYDFFGVAPRCHSEQSEESLNPNRKDSSAVPQDDSYQYDPKHQYAGVTRFKLGFGSVPLQRAGTFDIIIDIKKYYLYNFLRRLRRLF